MWHEDKGRDYLWETRGQQEEAGVSTYRPVEGGYEYSIVIKVYKMSQ